MPRSIAYARLKTETEPLITTVEPPLNSNNELGIPTHTGGFGILGCSEWLLKSPGVLSVIWIATCIRIMTFAMTLPSRARTSDFSVYYLSATALREGRNPYTTDLQDAGRRLSLDVGAIKHATDPPTYLVAFEPLTLMPPLSAYWTWIAINAFSLVLSLAILLGADRKFSVKGAMLFVALALWYPPVMYLFYWGQNKAIVLLLMTLMTRSIKRKRNASAGLSLALAGLLRVFPLLLVVYQAILRRWRLLAWTAAGLAVGMLATVAFTGIATTLSFPNGKDILLEHRYLCDRVNISLSAFVSRLFWNGLGAGLPPGLDAARRVASVAAALALLSLTVRATLTRRNDRGGDEAVFSLWVVASIMISPTAWHYYLVLLFIPFAQIAVAAANHTASKRTIWLGVVSYLLPFAAVTYAPLGRHGAPGLILATVDELWFASLAVAYLSAYFLVTDSGESSTPGKISQYHSQLANMTVQV